MHNSQDLIFSASLSTIFQKRCYFKVIPPPPAPSLPHTRRYIFNVDNVFGVVLLDNLMLTPFPVEYEYCAGNS